MQAADPEPLQLRAAQALRLVLGSPGHRRLGSLDQRADDVGLAPVPKVPREALVGLRAAIVRYPGRHDRLAVGRRRRDLRHLEVAVDGQRQRPGDRRRGHVEHVRAAPLGERRALLDPEAVLLVDDGDGEVAKAHVLLDQRVCSDRDLHVARGDQLANVRVLPGADGAREERDPDAELGADALDREEVLLGEDLGRRHEGALPPGLDRPEQRRQRDDGLPGADVALQQPLHRRRAREIAVDLGDRPFLRLGQGEWQHRAVALAAARRRAATARRPAARARLPCARARVGGRGARRRRAASGPPRPPASERGRCRATSASARSGSRLGGGERGRERISLRPDESERLAHERAQLLLRERLAGGVDGCVVGGLRHLAEVVALDLEAEAVQLATQAHARAGSQLRLEPRLVEPRRADLAGVVRDPRRQDLQPAAAAPGGDRAHDSFDHRLVLAEEVADRPLVRSAARTGAAGARARRRRSAGRAWRAASARPGRPGAGSRRRARAPRGEGRCVASASAAEAPGRRTRPGDGSLSARVPPGPSIGPGAATPPTRPGTRRSRPRRGRRACRRRRRDSPRARSRPAGAFSPRGR